MMLSVSPASCSPPANASSLPALIAPSNGSALPDYLPARMLNEFVYCPRLFYYEWVEGLFAHNQETIEGSLAHQRVDAGTGALPPTEELLDATEKLHARSVQLSSDRYGLIATIDLVEAQGDQATPVDYKRGAPSSDPQTGVPTAWDSDQVQIAVQALVLRENGYRCDEGILYYLTTKQRVRVPIDEALLAKTLDALAQARRTAASGRIPPPLVDSPKCPRCSLVGICLPDETHALRHQCWQGDRRQRLLFDLDDTPHPSLPPEDAPLGGARPVAAESFSRGGSRSDVAAKEPHGIAAAHPELQPRRLLPARDDLRPLYLNTQGLSVGKSGNVLQIKEKQKVIQEVRIADICQLNLFGNVQLSTQAIQTLCQHEIPIAYFSQGAWFYGVTQSLGVKNISLRREQFRLADSPFFCLRLAKALVSGKIRNQRILLQRNHIEPPARALALLRALADEAQEAPSLDQLRGIEGLAARTYFEHFTGMLKCDDQPDRPAPLATALPSFPFDFQSRNRRPPRDPVNALLSLAYSLLTKDLTVITQIVGLDPYLGFYHQPRFGRPSLALDLMEPFRPLIADSAVLAAINTRMVTPGDFVRAGDSVALTPQGRKALFRAYEQRMDTLVTHPLFGYRVNYRRILEIQTRLLARLLTGEIHDYPVFITR